MRPDWGHARPAIRLSTVLLPAPERPKSAVTPPPVVNAASSAKAPTWQRTSNSSIAAGGAHGGAPHQDFGSHERRERQDDRENAQAQRLRVASGHLGKGVDRERQRLGLARNVGYESDRGAEFAEAAGERKQHAREDTRQDERQRHACEHPDGRRA